MIDYGESAGGAIRMLVWVANAMAAHGHHVQVCSCSHSKFLEGAVESPCEYHSFGAPDRNTRTKRTLFQECTLVASICRHFKIVRPDIVISFGDHAFYYALMLKNVCHYKLVVSERADPYHPRGKGDKVRRRLYNHCDAGVFQTEMAARFFSPSFQDRSTVIPNPVKIAFSDAWKPNKQKVVTSLSRIDFFQKRLDVLIRAFELVTVPDVTLRIYGTGPDNEVEKLKRLISNSSKSKYIKLMGAIDGPVRAFEGSSVYVLCSDFEGIPNTVIEALAYGIPVISTDTSPGGAKMLLDGGRYGQLVPCGDPAALAHAIDQRFIDEGAFLKRAKAGRDSLQRFEEDSINKQWLSFLTHVEEEN